MWLAPALLFGLAPSGVYHAVVVTNTAVRSYRTISPLPINLGGIFSVALSMDSRPPGVTWRSALWSPDFPLSQQRQRLPRSTLTGTLPLKQVILL